MKKIDLKPICCHLCMLWGRCIYSDQHAFIAILSIDKELFLYSATRLQFRRHECTNYALVWNCGVVYSAFKWHFPPGK